MNQPISDETAKPSPLPKGQGSEVNGATGKTTPIAIALAVLAVGGVAFFVGRGTAGKPTSPPPAAREGASVAGGTQGENAPASATAAGTAAESPSGQPQRITLDPAAEKTAGIRTESVSLRPVQSLLTVPGVVQVGPDRVAKVTPPVGGKVAGILVRIGERVRAGQPLITLDSGEIAQTQATVKTAQSQRQQAAAQVRTAEAGVGQAQSRLASARIALSRQRELARAGAFSQGPLQSAQSEQAQAESELLQNQADLANKTRVAERNQKIFTAGVVSRQELEQAQTDQRQAEARIEQSQKRVALARQTLEREKKVFGRDLLSAQQVQTAEAEVRQAEGDVQRAEREAQATRTAASGAVQAVQNAQASLRALVGSGVLGDGGRLTLLAPLAGVVSDHPVTRGEAVSANTTLLVIENLNSVVVQASVPESDAARVGAGQRAEVTVSAYPGVRFGGIVQSVATDVDPKTRALAARILVANVAGRLRSEMFTQVHLATSGTRRAVAIPADTIMQDGVERSVFVTAEGGGYEKRVVVVGPQFGDRVEITSGLKDGERVVVQGAFTLKSEARKGELKEE